MLLLDTHVLIWLDEGNPRLGKIALQTIIESLAAGQLGFSPGTHFTKKSMHACDREDYRLLQDALIPPRT
jgi:hypothetical protein